MPRDLFHEFPITGQTVISTGRVPVPYHVYEGHAVLIGGTADLGAVARRLREEEVLPVETSDGQALMAVWVIEAGQASLGPHRQLQVAFFVTREAVEAVPAHPFAILRLLLLSQNVALLCHELWSDTQTVVAYSREILGLEASVADAVVLHDRDEGIETFRFSDPATGRPIVKGKVRQRGRAPVNTARSLMQLLGFTGTLRAQSSPWVTTRVINPIGTIIPHNAEAATFRQSEREVLQSFDPESDSLEFGDAAFRALQFTPQFVEHLGGFRFVYLTPEPRGAGPQTSAPPDSSGF